ncbi:hypothetical protein [Leptothoe sp. PORK10 BA2]|uniref:hypothetical protein n=1 Tax=Leptothoe sp. PORK10 BA2 TaxID=3110254 RepID=UPI002B2216DB|nr:hypothetical protein [Leptothoe sp. PORK10 BA2]MEA5462802.1 hypothetical protein [Leptothoe sp. PORK10 BA2]
MAVSAPLFSQCMRREKMVHRVVSQNGLLELSLTAQAHTRQLAGQRTRLLAYNGKCQALGWKLALGTGMVRYGQY